MPNKKELINCKFNKLTVIEEVNKKNENINQPGSFWYCQCECGNKVIVSAHDLVRNHTKSCGCLRKTNQFSNLNKMVDLTGKIFGKLTVIKYTEERWFGDVVWECECECGNITHVPSRLLKGGNVSSCGCLGKSLGEYLISKILQENSFNFIPEYSFDDFVFEDTNRKPRFDFFVNEKWIIEFDGEQHFYNEPHGYYTYEKLIKLKQHDKMKNEWCFNHAIPLIRIPYTKINSIVIDDLIPNTSTFLVSR